MPSPPAGEGTAPLEEFIAPLRKAHCLKALREAGDNKTQAARALGISINSFKRYTR
jgi:hypothetical protein